MTKFRYLFIPIFILSLILSLSHVHLDEHASTESSECLLCINQASDAVLNCSKEFTTTITLYCTIYTPIEFLFDNLNDSSDSRAPPFS